MLDYFFRKKKEDRNLVETTEQLNAVLTGEGLKTTSITKVDALNIPSVNTSVEFISSIVATLPIELYSKDKKGIITKITNDNRLKLLNVDTGDTLDAIQFKKALIQDMLLDGAGYAWVRWESNKVKGLYYVDDVAVSCSHNTDPIIKVGYFIINGKEFEDYQILRITRNTLNGMTGIGVLQTNPLLFNAMYNALKFENSSISSGTKRGFLKSAHKLEKDMLQSLKDAWKKLYSTDANSNDVMVLNEGITFEPASSTATENQLNESKKTNADSVYGLFGLSSAVFNGSSGGSESYRQAIKIGVMPVISALTSALNKFLLLESEKDSLYFVINTDTLLESSLNDRYQAYSLAIKDGWLQADEVRERENLKPLGLDFVKLGLADVLYDPSTKDIYTVNTGIKTTLGGGESDNATGDKE